MSSEKDGSRFEAVSGGTTEIHEREGAESGPTRTKEEIVCCWKVLTLSTSVFVANVQRLVDAWSDSTHELRTYLTSRLGQLVSMPEIRARAGVFVEPNTCFVDCSATFFKSGN